MNDTENTIIMKAGSNTFFFDIKESEKGEPFLVITQSRFKSQVGGRERVRMALFGEHIAQFIKALQIMSQKLGGVTQYGNQEKP